MKMNASTRRRQWKDELRLKALADPPRNHNSSAPNTRAPARLPPESTPPIEKVTRWVLDSDFRDVRSLQKQPQSLKTACRTLDFESLPVKRRAIDPQHDSVTIDGKEIECTKVPSRLVEEIHMSSGTVVRNNMSMNIVAPDNVSLIGSHSVTNNKESFVPMKNFVEAQSFIKNVDREGIESTDVSIEQFKENSLFGEQADGCVNNEMNSVPPSNVSLTEFHSAKQSSKKSSSAQINCLVEAHSCNQNHDIEGMESTDVLSELVEETPLLSETVFENNEIDLVVAPDNISLTGLHSVKQSHMMSSSTQISSIVQADSGIFNLPNDIDMIPVDLQGIHVSDITAAGDNETQVFVVDENENFLSPSRPLNNLAQPLATSTPNDTGSVPVHDAYENNQDDSEFQSEGVRQRKRNPSNWRRNQAKSARNTGKEHVNMLGQLVEAKSMGAGCKQNCRFKCHQRISNEQREKIFNQYWKLGDHSRQLQFIANHISVKKPETHNAVSANNEKTETVTYYFRVNTNMEKMCKTMFISTLNISETPLRTVRSKLDENTHGGEVHVISPDKRGKNVKMKPEVKKDKDDSVIEHIRTFKTVDSHYCRKRSKRRYLDSKLDRSKMWEKYKDWVKVNKPALKQIASKKYYANLFNTKFNLGFHQSKKDSCDMCFVYDLASPVQKEKMKGRMDLHLKNKEKAYVIKDADKAFAKSNVTTCYAIFDLEKVLEVPRLNAGVLYYTRKLNMYNFTVWEGISKSGYCYTWHEGEAKKGANEVATGVLKFIEVMVEKGKKSFLFWSDNCSAQNKNKYLFAMYTYASVKHQIKIVHRYLEAGHTHSEADNMHAAVERAAKEEKIFEPNDWIEIIKKASSTNPYTLTPIGTDVLDFHPLADTKQKWKNPNAKWKEVREIVVDPEKPGRVVLKHDLTQEKSVEIKVALPVQGRPLNLKHFQFVKAFNGPLPLNPAKLKDLAKLCNNQTIPKERHTFFKSLVNFPDLTHPDLLDDDVNEESDLDEDDPGLVWGDENDEETDYEEERIILTREKKNTKKRNEADGEDEDDDYL